MTSHRADPARTTDRASLANWRLPPANRWAFQNLRELVPSASVVAADTARELPQAFSDQLDLSTLASCRGGKLESFLVESFTDSLLVLQHGRKIWQWYGPHCQPSRPHILFSVSKSITAILVGILIEQHLLDPAKKLLHYLPGCKGSAFEDCSLQQLLDMQVALDFEESYLNTSGDYKRYRDASGWNPVDQLNPGPDLERYLYGLKKSRHDHGESFRYRSPNADLLGLLLERVAGISYAEFMSTTLWQPMGAKSDAYVTLDRSLLARGAGGICATTDDLARIGQLILDRGYANNRQVIAERWIEDTWNNGSRDAWKKGDSDPTMPEGSYRNQWYLSGNPDQAGTAIGIHGQWLYINPARSLVIARLSSQPEPLNDALDRQTMAVFAEISALLG